MTDNKSPAGWKLVPLVPTDEMVQEGSDSNPTCWNETTDNGFPLEVAQYVYAAMLAASPAPIDSAKVEDTGEPVALPKDVLDALRFYAHGHHYEIDDSQQQFDTVSGEPTNWMFSEKDDDCTMFEDGGIARAVLAGRSAGFEEPVEPFEGEVFTALSTAPTTGSAPVAALATQSDRAVGMAMTNEQGEKYGALLDSSIPDRTPLYAAQLVNTVIDVHHDPSWQEGYKEGYDDAEIVYKAAGVETFENTQGADARPVAIYQSRLHSDDEKTWSDCYEATFYACKAYPDKYETRIVYATRDAAPIVDAISDVQIIEMASDYLGIDYDRVPYGVVNLCRTVIAASAPREETS